MADKPDLSQLPTGEMAWQALVDHVCTMDVTSERHFLEIKSDVDLNDNAGRIKVAKFILGGVNRDPVRAATRFDGKALMFLGVGQGTNPGIPGFEAMELQKYVRKFTGMPDPDWDFKQVSVGDGRSVYVIIVGPPDPTKQPLPCASDGEAGTAKEKTHLQNGRIYIRGDGETRAATSDEIKEMLERRSTAARPKVEIDVEVVGVARCYEFGDAFLEQWIEEKRQTLLDALPKPKPSAERKQLPSFELLANTTLADALRNNESNFALTAFGGSTVPEDRTKEQYIAEIDSWAGEVRAMIPALLDDMAACVWPGVAFKVTNLTDSYLGEPEIHVHIEGPAEALNKQHVDDMPKILREMPHPPREWGPRRVNSFMENLNYGSMLNTTIPNLAGLTARGPNYGMVRFKNGGSVTCRFQLDALRPHAIVSSDNDDFVLVLRDETESELQATWTATVKGRDGRWQGELTVPIQPKVTVFTDYINKQLKPDGKQS